MSTYDRVSLKAQIAYEQIIKSDTALETFVNAQEENEAEGLGEFAESVKTFSLINAICDEIDIINAQLITLRKALNNCKTVSPDKNNFNDEYTED